MRERLPEDLERLRPEQDQPAVEQERRDRVDADRLRLPRRAFDEIEIRRRIRDHALDLARVEADLGREPP
jgi:hypothetical protein